MADVYPPTSTPGRGGRRPGAGTHPWPQQDQDSQQLLSWEVYFDAVGGKLIQDRTKEDIFQALWWGLENRI